MNGQQTLDSGPARIGLYRKVIADGAVDHAAWLRARASGEFVGTCRCGDFLVPAAPSQVAGRIDYLARCRREECAWEVLSPGGRVLDGSSRRSEQRRTAS